MLSKGVNVAIGTDSTAINDDDDMLQEMRLVKNLHREPGLDAPAITSHQTLGLATANAAKPTFFQQQIGALEVGRRADLVLLDLTAIEEPYLDPDISPVDALVYRAKTRDVDTVMIDGVVVLQGGRFTGVNEAEVTRELREQLSRPLEPGVVETRQMVQRLMPYVRQFYGDWQAVGGNPHYRYNSRG
jgi:cytosine/adenosine deaminase-related metal-dependent hydrolase